MTPLPDCFCPVDGTRVPTGSLAWCCPVCRGPLDLDFAPTPASLKSLAGRVNSLWRYAECLPLSSPSVSLGEGRTPLVPLKDGVSAKLDFLMPTLSFKDRGAVLLAELALRLRPGRVVADSSGNAGTAVAAYCARAQLPCTVYVPDGTSAKKLEQIGAHGARLEVVPGDREATARAAREAADEEGTFYASHVFNPYFLHGTKTYVHELWEDLGGKLPDVIVVPVGNGTLLLGASLAIAELHAAGMIDRRPPCTRSSPPPSPRSPTPGTRAPTTWSESPRRPPRSPRASPSPGRPGPGRSCARSGTPAAPSSPSRRTNSATPRETWPHRVCTWSRRGWRAGPPYGRGRWAPVRPSSPCAALA